MTPHPLKPLGSSRPRARLIALASVAALPLALLPAQGTTAGSNRPVTVDSPYVKANDASFTSEDAISACGDNKRQQNEPTVAVDPTRPRVVTSGSNDYCTTEIALGTWAGFYRSTDHGQQWTDSLLPGYPTDTSEEGLASPLHRLGITNAGDPVQAWDLQGRVFYMGNAFNRVQPQYGSVWVATYNQHAAHYQRTVLLARGTPAPSGVFNDKTAIEVDRGVDSSHQGNVYTAWSVFQAYGNNEIHFARSIDHGKTFSHPIKISEGSLSNQNADIAVTSDGTVYVAWRGNVGSAATGHGAMLYVKSVDGGKTFTKPHVAADYDGFNAADNVGDPGGTSTPEDAEAAETAHEQAYMNGDGPESEGDVEPLSVGNARDCGSGPFSCVSGFVFFRHRSQPHITADPKGDPNTLWMAFDAIRPSTEVPSNSTYNTAPVRSDGTRMVGQGQLYLTKTTNGGKDWSDPTRLAPSQTGHQFFPDINADGGRIFALWHDSRNDPAYSVQRPPGNAAAKDAAGYHLAVNGLDTYGASSTDGGASWQVVRLSDYTQMPNYEMFGDRRVPFHGDYNYVSSVDGFAYGVWTDTRQVVGGDDPRYDGGEGFDVKQCRVPDDTIDTGWSLDSCPNAGGLDQDIFGASMTP